MQYSKLGPNKVKYSKVQYSTVQYSTEKFHKTNLSWLKFDPVEKIYNKTSNITRELFYQAQIQVFK